MKGFSTPFPRISTVVENRIVVKGIIALSQDSITRAIRSMRMDDAHDKQRGTMIYISLSMCVYMLTAVSKFCSISSIMNTATEYKRLNITLPKDIAEYVQKNTENISKYIADALNERIAREKREHAMKVILSGPPTFTDIGDSTAYVRALREEDKKRDERLGLL